MKKNSQNGFTLVEVMIVVAVMGIMAAVAIPQFAKFRAKARIPEGRVYLAGIHTAQLGYFAEYQEFTPCLKKAGYSPPANQTQFFFSHGFSDNPALLAANQVATDHNCAAEILAPDAPPAGANFDTITQFFWAGKEFGSATTGEGPDLSFFNPPSEYDPADRLTYTAGAAGCISRLVDPCTVANSAYIQIDENKNITTVRIGY